MDQDQETKLGLRQFHVRGPVKAQMELLWACLTYNLQHWIRLTKLRTTPAVSSESKRIARRTETLYRGSRSAFQETHTKP
jgi:hypothetical protein